jgi:hypothetical protein
MRVTQEGMCVNVFLQRSPASCVEFSAVALPSLSCSHAAHRTLLQKEDEGKVEETSC